MNGSQLLYIITTAIAVSIDSFFAGFAVGNKIKNSFSLPVCAALLTLAMCLVAALPVVMIKQYIDQDILGTVGACILLAVGLLNMVSIDNKPTQHNGSYIKQCVAIGFAVALDATVACVSLTVMNYNAAVVALIFAATHLVTVWLGQKLAKTKKVALVLNKFDWLGGAMLIALAVVKCI